MEPLKLNKLNNVKCEIIPLIRSFAMYERIVKATKVLHQPSRIFRHEKLYYL